MKRNQTRASPLTNYQHDHPPVRDVNAELDVRLTPGQRVADGLAAFVGSWPFILTQSLLLLLWITFNVWLAFHPGVLRAWDPYPFILLNLVLSFQAAYTGPVVMMSQNRQAEKDRLMAQSDYECNVIAEQEIKMLMEHLLHQDLLLEQVIQQETLLIELRDEVAALRRESRIARDENGGSEPDL